MEELEQSKMDKRVKEQAITIFENTTAQLGTVQKMVSTHAKNLENVKKRNDRIKTAAFFLVCADGNDYHLLLFSVYV